MKTYKAAATLLLLLTFTAGGATAKEHTVTNINESPSSWWNKKVTVQGEVEKLYSRGAFILQEGEKRENNDHHNQILVIPTKSHASGGPSIEMEQPKSGAQ